MDIFNKLREPIVLKEDSNAVKQLQQLEACLQNAPESIRLRIEQDKRSLNYGIRGEEAILFELKNSHIPMYILHDVFFCEGELKTQIDYIVITRKLVLIIESKNLYGNISIDNQGNFTRTMQVGKTMDKEGFYSPITQNKRHLDMIREKRRTSMSFLERVGFEKNFNENYKSLVVIANPKSVIDMKYAPKEVKEQIVKVDVLNTRIKKLNDESSNKAMSDKQMKALADFFLENSVSNEMDYTEKYRTVINEQTSVEHSENVVYSPMQVDEKQEDNDCEKEHGAEMETLPVYRALKEYRYQQSRKENVKAYYIYSNAQMEEIIRENPQTLADLKKIKGFGEVKCERYGNEILRILKELK